MKHIKEIGLVLIMLFMIPLQSDAEGLGNARLGLIDGDVQIRSEDSSEWLPAALNMPLRDGDSIWVPDGARAEVQLAGGTQVRLDELSSLDLLKISRYSSQFYLAEGSAYVNFRGGRSNSLVQIDTPVSSFRAYDSAAFNVDVAGRGDTDLSVYKGLVYAESRSGRINVNAGKVLEISDEYADLAPLGRADAWERWNTERNRRFEERRYSSRYLPDELETYASDFDDNGRWVSVRDYGYVWTPTVQVSVSWSPYRNGRWSWIGSDYVWVGYEPWGWAPYHYGRWAYLASIGWFWVPPARGAVYWGPGYVGWVRTPTYVAWVPLAPRETYYGHGYYGPHSVNIINVNINTIVVKNKYKNVYVKNSVTAVHHDTFVKGKHVDFKTRENPFFREKIHVGRPDIKPERETRMAVIRDIPKAKEPPKKIRESSIKEIKETRPMVREKDKSVFSPDKPRKQMTVQGVEVPRERKREKLEARSKDRDRTLMGPERPQNEERGREMPPITQPAEKPEIRSTGESAPPAEPRVRQREQLPAKDRQIPSQRREQRQVEPQGRQSEPRQEALPPKRTQKPEIRSTGESAPPAEPRVRQREQLPAKDRQIQREERQQKQQQKQIDKQEATQDKAKEKQEKNTLSVIKEKRKKAQWHEEKDLQKSSGDGIQQRPVGNGSPAPR